MSLFTQSKVYSCPVGWGSRIHRLLLCRGVRPPNECPGYDTKQSNGEVPAMLELWGMRSTPSLPSLPDPLWPGVVVPDKGPIYGLNRTKPCFFHYTERHTHAKLNILKYKCFWQLNRAYILNRMLVLNWIISNRTVFWHWNCIHTKLNCLT